MKDGVIWGHGTPLEMLTADNLRHVYDLPGHEIEKRRVTL